MKDHSKIIKESLEEKNRFYTRRHFLKEASFGFGGLALANLLGGCNFNDSTATSNSIMRDVQITEIFPELGLVNSFTPNGDGVNDFWDIVNLQFYTKVNISIADQNGVRVFNCNTPECKWDGKLNGAILPSGSYFYMVDLNGGKRKYQGTVTLLK